MSITIGVDLSKLSFDVCILTTDQEKTYHTFDNKKTGFVKFCKLIQSKESAPVAMEATGIYGENLCQFLFMKKISVYLLNPARISLYARSLMTRNKTDKSDSFIIATYLANHKSMLKTWEPRSENHEIMRCLMSHYNCIHQDIIRTRGHIEANSNTDMPGNTYILKLHNAQMRHHEKRLKSIVEAMQNLIKSDSSLKTVYDLVLTIPGIGEKTAMALLAYLPNLTLFKCAKQLAAFAGVNPSVRQSGSSLNRKLGITKTGSRHLRTCLYMAALNGYRHNAFSNLKKRLEEKGKKPKVIVIAILHKLLRIVFGVITKGKAYMHENAH